MTEFTGLFSSPPFETRDREAIESRLQEDYPDTGEEDNRIGKSNLAFLCKLHRSGESLDRVQWHQLREWSRDLPTDAQQLKTDAYRLLKAVSVSDEAD